MPWGLQRWQGGHDLHFLTFRETLIRSGFEGHGFSRAVISQDQSGFSPWGIERQLNQSFLRCYRRQPWLASAARRDPFVKVLEQVRQCYQWVVRSLQIFLGVR